MDNCWLYDGKCLENPPEGYYGFVYRITDYNGDMYLGKKAFTHKRKTKLSKKARKGTRKRVKVTQIDSKWLTYWGSCKPLLQFKAVADEMNMGVFKREIVCLCKTRQELNYRELEVLIKEDVLFKGNYWNGNIMSRFFRGKI